MAWSSVVGHRQVIDLLRQAVSRGRVPQSLLLAGPDGVGKRTTAVALAQAVNCPRRDEGDACGQCPTCLRIANGTHSDVVMLDRGEDASIGIRTLRDRLLDVVGYRPFEAARRVFIIDGADDLTKEAQDALLKTLEEPPSASILILVTAFPDALLPTIQSRCRRLRFGPLSEADVARVLVRHAGVEAGRAAVLAAMSGGSVARALAEADDALGADRQTALGILEAARQRSIGPRLRAAAALVQHGSKRRDREALDARLAALATLTRDLGAVLAGTSAALANLDLEPELRALAASFDPARLDDAFGSVADARRALDRHASPKIVADWLAVRL
jgi:DNA polymerase-3 subunit delta'